MALVKELQTSASRRGGAFQIRTLQGVLRKKTEHVLWQAVGECHMIIVGEKEG